MFLKETKSVGYTVFIGTLSIRYFCLPGRKKQSTFALTSFHIFNQTHVYVLSDVAYGFDIACIKSLTVFICFFGHILNIVRFSSLLIKSLKKNIDQCIMQMVVQNQVIGT